MQRWFDLIDETPLFSKVTERLERGLDFREWWDETREADEYGRVRLSWPKGSDARLGMQLLMYRAFAVSSPDVLAFPMTFLRSSGHNRYDDMLADMRQRVFDPMARDLRRRVVRAAEVEAAGEVPASDRTVTLDHNSPARTEASESLDNLAEAIRSANDYDDVEDREQRLAEVSATKALLGSARVRAEAMLAVAYRCLKFLATKFLDNAIGAAAGAALALLGRYTGFW